MNAYQSVSTSTYKPVTIFDLRSADFSEQDMLATAAGRFPVTGSEGSSLREKFEKPADQWRHNTAFSSSVTEMVLDANYQQIIGMGVAVVP